MRLDHIYNEAVATVKGVFQANTYKQFANLTAEKIHEIASKTFLASYAAAGASFVLGVTPLMVIPVAALAFSYFVRENELRATEERLKQQIHKFWANQIRNMDLNVAAKEI